MKSLAGSLELYRLDNSRYPDSEQGLAALMAKPSLGRIPESWRGPYLNAKSLPKDPWERDYVYNSDGSNFDLMSLGADGEPGGQDRDQDIAHQ